MNKQELVKLFALATVAAPVVLLGASIALAKEISGPLTGSVPRAICGPGDHTESGLQGQTTPQERSSGDSQRTQHERFGRIVNRRRRC